MAEILDVLGSYWWVLVILIVFVYSAFEEWLSFKSKQRELGASADDLEDRLDAMQREWDAERTQLKQRIEHLETIVTSETWDALHDDATVPLTDQHEEPSQQEKAERVARHLRNR